MIGKKHQPYPKGWIDQAVRVLYLTSGGATDGVQNIILMMRMEEKSTTINLNTWELWTVSG